MTNAALSRPSGLSTRRYLLGLACLAVSLAASLFLAGDHFDVLEAPGCGGDSACGRAAASAWGKLPVLDWPLSLFGLAWFSALAAAWTAAHRGAGSSRVLRGAVRLGSLGSLLYLGAMVTGGYLCPYCLLVHTGALAFLVVVERAPRSSERSGPIVAWAAAAFALVTALEVGADAWVLQRVEQQRVESTRLALEAGRDGSASTAFTGRYLMGPERASIRLVIFSDYQCPVCRTVEAQARELVETLDHVSLSAKHYPLCSDCNRHTTGNLHPDACQAALVAETAGLLGGGDAFWRTHQWLFEREARYTTDELREHLRDLELDAEAFFAELERGRALALVEQDVEEAHALGVSGTPLVFINGVELKGIGAPDALPRAVAELSAMGLAAADGSADRPQSAAERFVEGWRSSPLRNLDGGKRTWATGPADASVEVVVWGDYLTDLTAEADAAVRAIAGRRDDVRYVFRHFPIHTDCNPISQRTIEPESCLAHQAAHVAGELGGQEGYWRMHEWLMGHQVGFDQEALFGAAAELGIELDALLAGLQDPEVGNAIALDCGMAARSGVFSVPSIFVNGRQVPAWSEEDLLDGLIDLAAIEGPPADVVPGGPVAASAAVDPVPSRIGLDAAGLRAELDGMLKSSGAAAERARLAAKAVRDPESAAELERLLDEQGATEAEREALGRTMERLKGRQEPGGAGVTEAAPAAPGDGARR